MARAVRFAALSILLCLAGGFPHWILYGAFAAGLYFLFRTSRERSRAGRAFVRIAAAGAISLAILCPSILASSRFVEASGFRETRHGMGSAYPLPLRHLRLYFLPEYQGTPRRADYGASAGFGGKYVRPRWRSARRGRSWRRWESSPGAGGLSCVGRHARGARRHSALRRRLGPARGGVSPVPGHRALRAFQDPHRSGGRRSGRVRRGGARAARGVERGPPDGARPCPVRDRGPARLPRPRLPLGLSPVGRRVPRDARHREAARDRTRLTRTIRRGGMDPAPQRRRGAFVRRRARPPPSRGRVPPAPLGGGSELLRLVRSISCSIPAPWIPLRRCWTFERKTLAAPPGAHLPVGDEVERRDAAAMNTVDRRTSGPPGSGAISPDLFGPGPHAVRAAERFSAVLAGRAGLPSGVEEVQGPPTGRRSRPPSSSRRTTAESRAGRIPRGSGGRSASSRSNRAVRALDTDGATALLVSSQKSFSPMAALSVRGPRRCSRRTAFFSAWLRRATIASRGGFGYPGWSF